MVLTVDGGETINYLEQASLNIIVSSAPIEYYSGSITFDVTHPQDETFDYSKSGYVLTGTGEITFDFAYDPARPTGGFDAGSGVFSLAVQGVDVSYSVDHPYYDMPLDSTTYDYYWETVTGGLVSFTLSYINYTNSPKKITLLFDAHENCVLTLKRGYTMTQYFTYDTHNEEYAEESHSGIATYTIRDTLLLYDWSPTFDLTTLSCLIDLDNNPLPLKVLDVVFQSSDENYIDLFGETQWSAGTGAPMSRSDENYMDLFDETAGFSDSAGSGSDHFPVMMNTVVEIERVE